MKKRVSRHILIFIELICLLLLLPGCFRKEEKVYSLSGAEMALQTVAAEESLQFYGADAISLSPGVYQIRVNSGAKGQESAYVEILPGESGYDRLRGNGVLVFPGQEYTDFEVYAVGNVRDAHLFCEFYDMMPDRLTSVEIYRINRGGRMALFVLFMLFLAVDGLLIFRREILAGRVLKEQQAVFWTLVFSVLLACLPYLTGYFSLGADTAFHWLRIEGLKESLLNRNTLPVRVQSYWMYGHGYAVSSFYGDFFLLIPAGLRLIGFSLMTSYKAFVFLVMAGTAAIAYFSFYQCVKDRYAALFGAVLYVLAPYRIYNFYNRGAVGEYLAMTFFPLICCGLYLLYTEDCKTAAYKTYKWYLIWGLTAIIQSHVLSTEITAFFILALCLVLWRKTLRRETLAQLLEAAGTALVLNCWFWLPMLYMMGCDRYFLQSIISGHIQDMGTWFSGIFQLTPNKGGHQTGMENYEAIQIGAGALLMILVYLGMVFWAKKKPVRKAEKILLGFVFLSVFMSTKYFPWDFIAGVPGLGYLATSIQFPTRLMAPASVFCAMFGVFFFLYLKEPEKDFREGSASMGKESREMLKKGCLCVLLVITAGSALYQVNDIALRSKPTYLYTAENMGTQSVVNGEYLLEGVDKDAYRYHGPVLEEGLKSCHYEKNGTEIVMQVENTTDKIRYLELPLTGYKGYGLEAEAGGKEDGEVPAITDERGAHGDIRIAVPAYYTGKIRVFYQGFPLFHIAEAVSAAGFAGVLLWHLRKRVVRKINFSAQKWGVKGRKGNHDDDREP